MTDELMQTLQSSMWDTAITIIKYMLIAGVIALPFAYINGKLKKKEQKAKDKKDEAKIQHAVEKALENRDRKR